MFSKYFSGKSQLNNCCICDEIRTGRLCASLFECYPIKNRFCFESPNFIVVPSVSPLNAGHVLIFTKEHRSSMMSIPVTVKAQLFEVIAKMYDHVRANFGTPFIFEHGANDPADQGCGVNHAHIHILPLEVSLRNQVMKEIRLQYPPDNWGSIQELLFNESISPSDLLYGENPDRMLFYNSGMILSQSIRRIISAIKGSPQWDWKEHYGWQEFNRTYESFHIRAIV